MRPHYLCCSRYRLTRYVRYPVFEIPFHETTFTVNYLLPPGVTKKAEGVFGIRPCFSLGALSCDSKDRSNIIRMCVRFRWLKGSCHGYATNRCPVSSKIHHTLFRGDSYCVTESYNRKTRSLCRSEPAGYMISNTFDNQNWRIH